MKRFLFLFTLLLTTLAMSAATVTFMANGRVYETKEYAEGEKLGEMYYYPTADPFYSLEFAGWSTNDTGEPAFVNEETIVNGDMTLYAQWIVEKKSTHYLKRLYSREELEDGEQLYLIPADGKHIMWFSTYDYTNISFTSGGRTYTGYVEHFGKQTDTDLPAGNDIIAINEDDYLGLYFRFDYVHGLNGSSYDMLGGYARTAFFAYQFPDEDEPVFCNVTNHGREDLAYLGYNFDWNLSFTADGFAKLENGEYGYIYYSEEPSAKWGYNFRLSKTAQPNLLAYKLVEQRDIVCTSTISYNIVSVVSEETQVMAIMDKEVGNAGVAMMWEDRDGNPLDNPAYAVLEGCTCTLFAEYDKDIYKGEFTCTDSEAGKMQQQEVWGEMREVYAVTPTKDCTVNFNLVYAPKTITIGDKEVSAADGETDVFGDGSVIVDKGDIQITGANISGDIVSPYSNTWIKASGTNNITGNITADSFMSIFCWDDEPAIFNIAGSISCTGAVANDYNGQILDLSNVETFISSPANSKDRAKAMGTSVSAISGFEDINYDSEEFVIAQPLNGHYDTTKKMLVDADGNPSAVFCLMTKGHYTTGVTSPSASSQNSTTVKYIQDGQIIITRNSRNYNTVGIEMR